MADSTTSRLTVAAIRLIGAWCLAFNAGVIVRHKGVEIGVEATDLTIKDGMVKWTGEWVKLKDFTIRKLTLTTLEADLAERRTEQWNYDDIKWGHNLAPTFGVVLL